MTGSIFTCLRVAGVALTIRVALADDAKCYYPNGAEAPEKPCSSAEGSACCPDKWACLDNGLCYYEANSLWGRYSCTDKSWKSSGCPSNLCTYDMSASGGESITQCKDHDNQWCCNADATHVNCCKESPEPRPFFALQDGQAYATVGASLASDAPNLASVTGEATSGGGDSKPSSTAGPSASADSNKSSSDKSSATPTPVTTVSTQVSSGSAGIVTQVVTSVITPPASATNGASPTDSGEKKSKLPVIIGCAVGIPVAIAFIAIIAWLLYKRRQQKKTHPYSETPDLYANGNASPDFAGGAKLSKSHKPAAYKSEANGLPELPAQSVGPGRPISSIPGKAELESGGGFNPGAAPPHAPHLVGVGGGNGTANGRTPQSSWGSAPPGYSPGMNQNNWAPGHGPTNSVELPATPDHGGNAPAGAGAVQTDGGRYIPYRPPPGHAAATATRPQSSGAAGGGLQNVPEMAEMSAVKTPPA